MSLCKRLCRLPGESNWFLPTGEWSLVPLVGRAFPGLVFNGKLCAQEDFKQSVCWWVGLCSHPVGCLAWGIPALEAYRMLCGARSWWENGGLQEGSCQSVIPWTTATNVFVPPESHSHPLPLQETLQYQQVCLAQALMRSLLFSLVPGAHEILSAPFKIMSFCLPQSCGIPAVKPPWPSKTGSLGAPPPLPDPQAGEPDIGLRTFTTVVEPLWYNYFPVCGLPPSRYGIWFYRDCAPSTVLLWLLLCLWV